MQEDRQAWELLTPEEREFLRPIMGIMSAVSEKYRHINKTNRKVANDLQNEDFRTMCAEQNIDIERATSIASKLFDCPWYCYFISSVTLNEETGEAQHVFSLVTYKNPAKQTELKKKTYPGFYDAVWDTSLRPEEAYQAILKSLHLPPDCKFIGPTHYQLLGTIAEIYMDRSERSIFRTGGHRISAVEFGIDKPNTKIWNMLSTANDGQLQFDFITGKSGTKKGKDIAVVYSVNYDELEDGIIKDLQPFDKRVYFVVGSLCKVNNGIVTAGQIYRAMGFSGVPGQREKERIHKSMLKMAHTWITIDNASELAAGYKYPDASYQGYLLPLETARIRMNGEVVDSYHIFREPPMISFARGRKQLTTVDIKLLAAPVNKTNNNIAIEHYLQTAISRAKTGNRRQKIKFATLFEEINMTSKKQQQRAKEPIKIILEYFQENDFIRSYTIDEEGITFTFSADQKEEKQTKKT